MKLRPPSTPLITVDPYFSIWCPGDKLNEKNTVHWTGAPNTIWGIVTIDGEDYRFLGESVNDEKTLKQVSFDYDAFASEYIFEGAGIRLTAVFTSPLLPDDLYLISRPVSYLKLSYENIDNNSHNVTASITVSDEICLDKKRNDNIVDTAVTEIVKLPDNIAAIKMGNARQNVLGRCGDDVRIDWGYFYLSVQSKNAEVKECTLAESKSVCATAELDNSLLFTFAYDDIKSILYFGKQLSAYWCKDGKTISDAIVEAYKDYDSIYSRCRDFSDKLYREAVDCGGEKYAEILALSLRQCIAAHKLVVDTEGNILFISKECFSNGCAATADVSYPSIPLFLIYNPELVRGMLRPIFKFANTDEWTYEFAPHDAGRYPFVTGQAYGMKMSQQMPVEECGNVLVMTATSCIASKDYSFARENMNDLKKWTDYLLVNGFNPDNQLCTDDFAGHLAHNCNLTLKAIMGICSMGIICEGLGDTFEAEKYFAAAKDMAKKWPDEARNEDGSFRLAFDKPDTFSMKYNIIWDRIFNTKIMAPEIIRSEFSSYKNKMRPYGMPLDNRSEYTKSDWIVWTATLAYEKEDFESFIKPLWDMYNFTDDRVPMTDWYFTTNAKQRGFQNRTVVGGFFIKLLDSKKICKIKP